MDLKENKPVNPRLYIVFSDLIKLFYTNKEEKLGELDLKPSQARLLHFLSDYEGLSQQDLCDIYGLKPSSMSEQLSSLESSGYIRREQNPENRRMVMITVTPVGKETAGHIYNLFIEYCSEHLGSFSQEEIKIFESLLEKFCGKN